MHSAKRAYLPLLGAVAFWGLSFISIKASLDYFPPMALGFARYFLALLFLAPMKAFKSRGEKLARADLGKVAASGLVGISLYFFMENNGVKLNSPSESSLIIGTIPVMLMIAERIVDRKPLSARSYGGALITLAGVALLVAEGISFSGSAAGYLYMFGAGVSWVLYCFMTRGLFEKYSRLSIVLWQSFFGFLGFIPLALLELSSVRLPGPEVILHLVFLGIFCSAFGYYFYAIALERLGPGKSGVFLNLIPVVTVAAGFVLGEKLSILELVGGGVVVGGVFLATWTGARNRDSVKNIH